MIKNRSLLTSLLIITGFFSWSQAETSFKSYDMQSAIINYEIKGSGKITDNSRLEVEGRSTLLFTDWGARKLYKEKYTEVTTGAGTIKNTNTIRTLFIENRGTVYRVDFKKKKIEKREDPVMKIAITAGKDLYKEAMEELMSKGKKVGTSVVLGYACDEWQYKGKKRCFYKGIPLKEESTLLGIQLVKVAISAEFDKEIAEDTFALPTFVHDESKGFLLEEKKAKPAKNEYQVEKEMNETSIDMRQEGTSDDDPGFELTSDQKEKSREEFTENMFKHQKDLLLKLLSEMQEARVCLESADDKNEANQCIEKMVEIKEEMTGEKDKESEISVWTEVAKEKTWEDLEEDIMDMKRRMPCIRRSRNFDDLSACMK
ncbi:MAG: hypothetical protein U9Q90_07050 [Campylobacterota bacterium]|nr:hypothetical protein [Campylobacterota bacterium]